MKYKVGDKVRIRHDLRADGKYVAKKMTLYAGKEATITKACPANGAYTIDLDEEYYWYSSAFDDVSETDKAVNPDYYQFHGYDVFDIAEHFGLSFPLGNALKYLLRCKHKENEEQDLHKAIKCIERHLEMMKRDKQGHGNE